MTNPTPMTREGAPDVQGMTSWAETAIRERQNRMGQADWWHHVALKLAEKWPAIRDEHAAKVESLEKENERLKAALRPFADIYVATTHDSGVSYQRATVSQQWLVEHILKARQALEHQGGE